MPGPAVQRQVLRAAALRGRRIPVRFRRPVRRLRDHDAARAGEDLAQAQPLRQQGEQPLRRGGGLGQHKGHLPREKGQEVTKFVFLWELVAYEIDFFSQVLLRQRLRRQRVPSGGDA